MPDSPKQKAWREQHKEELREYNKQYREKNKEKLREQSRKYREDNAVIIKERKRRYYQENKDSIRDKRRGDPKRTEQAAKWNKENQEKRRIISRRDKIRRRGGGEMDQQALEYEAILRLDPCSYCGAPMKHVDHIDPIVKGGTSEWDNLTSACASCNSRKNASTLLLFLYENSKDISIGVN